MKRFKFINICFALLTVAALCSACSEDEPDNNWWDEEEEKKDPTDNNEDQDEPEIVEVKPRYIWIDAAANFVEFANSKENIARDLKKAADAGFTDIVVDVRNSMGDVLFNTSVVDQATKLPTWKGGYHYHVRTETWDYLQAFIDAGHELGLKIHAAINTFTGEWKVTAVEYLI